MEAGLESDGGSLQLNWPLCLSPTPSAKAAGEQPGQMWGHPWAPQECWHKQPVTLRFCPPGLGGLLSPPLPLEHLTQFANWFHLLSSHQPTEQGVSEASTRQHPSFWYSLDRPGLSFPPTSVRSAPATRPKPSSAMSQRTPFPCSHKQLVGHAGASISIRFQEQGAFSWPSSYGDLLLAWDSSP